MSTCSPLPTPHPGSSRSSAVADERDRLAALRRLRLVDTPAEERFDRIVRIAETLFGVPMAEINLIDEDRQYTKSAFPAANAGKNTPRGDSFCTVTVADDRTLHVPDATADPRFAQNPLVTGGPGIRFYAGHPLSANGQRVGSLCLVDDEPRTLTGPEQQMLADLATWVERELERDSEMAYAADVQARLLPRTVPTLDDYEVAGTCVTAREVGGDFYGWHAEDDRLDVVLVDVMGKGVGPGLLAAGLRAALRATASGAGPARGFNLAAALVEDDFAENGSFATAFAAQVDLPTGAVSFVDAGHSLGLVVQADGACRRLPSTCLPLGVLPGYEWVAAATSVAPGETLVVVSDGILDHFATTAEAVSHVAALVSAAPTARAALEEITAAAARSDATGQDDLTVVAVRRLR
ncbi:Phosphoserine phosphatase RsbU [Nocardioides aquaticus]|uniref:Phosphoserine phosphatase RsbU n=1 Tax=Nocardioides aquaticus TaxID=160826 RepID=A0ABX8EDJ8_9ACTN|nr:SpoIIE family protein phosphatase [Nocardioides aquaticus]QVT78326.1 Phosphoserine phosphatase RsbU [Nocardioides aquaticus]